MSWNNLIGHAATIENLKKTLSINPKDTDASKLLAQIYIRNKDWENAKNVIKNAIAQNPTNSDLYYFLAKTAPENKPFQIENLKKALENQKNLTISPEQIKQELKKLRG